jgi:hypothetical protein
MVCLAGRSIFKKLSIVVSALFALPSLVSAQRPAVPVPHPPAAPVHVSAPFVYHAPVIPPPIMRSPGIYAPISTPLRSGTVPFGGAVVRPPLRPIRPWRPVFFIYASPFVFGDPFWRFNSCWPANCEQFWPLTFGAFEVSSPGPVNYVVQASEAPVYVFGNEREDTPQLFLKDGTILNVTDYWVADNQLHFTMIEEAGAPAVEHSIPFDELDLQKSIDANTRQGFRFVLRNEPAAQYIRDHPEGPPPLAVPPHP